MKKIIVLFVVLGFSCKPENKTEIKSVDFDKKTNPITLKSKEVQTKPDKMKMNEVFLEGVWAENEEDNALFFIEKDSIKYTDNINKPFQVRLFNDTLFILIILHLKERF